MALSRGTGCSFRAVIVPGFTSPGNFPRKYSYALCAFTLGTHTHTHTQCLLVKPLSDVCRHLFATGAIVLATSLRQVYHACVHIKSQALNVCNTRKAALCHQLHLKTPTENRPPCALLFIYRKLCCVSPPLISNCRVYHTSRIAQAHT